MIKQTQTKMFDFSDVGLDFCAGSKLLFPSVFKKFLATGYNQRTGATASISGNQVTLNFGVSHGYAADRVLKVIATGGYSKEVYIDSVTDQTVTFTDSSTTALNGTITTYIAPLGWSLLYEDSSVHLYKMKNLSEQDVYVRFVFQTNANYVTSVGVCVGMSADTTTGTITDTATNILHATSTTPQVGFQFVLCQVATSQYNNYTYSQGYNNFGKGLIVGSIYHLAILCNGYFYANYMGEFNAILPCSTLYSDIDPLKTKMVVFGYNPQTLSNVAYTNQPLQSAMAYLGNIPVKTRKDYNELLFPMANNGYGLNSYFSNSIDSFNTTACSPLPIIEASTSQHLGYIYGAYSVNYFNQNIPDLSNSANNPTITNDIDFNNKIIVQMTSYSTQLSASAFIAVPLEEIKIVS
ncbi:hypothetical protein [Acinetobacter sp. ANC 3791]|uniref:hypothetical protein n=1 Tax=Acinetobacter sp. ANC 3791 TaxID=2529836 RepID=UPI00103BB872|nr:hypothetical protein [Acinetobacter sp. ANC 3791]TCB83402.1 hypothetical protein E0H90_11780 [Acinetobacter sp. ANC 3791]